MGGMGLRVLEGEWGAFQDVSSLLRPQVPPSPRASPPPALHLLGAPSPSHTPASLSLVFLSHLQLEIVLCPCSFTYFFVCLLIYHLFLPLEVGRPQY